MSGDLSARDVIARKLACQHNGDPHDDSDWEFHVDHALDLIDTLAAAGWELHRAGEVVPTSDVLNLAQQWDDRVASRDTSDRDRPARSPLAAELRALTDQEGQ